jgi:hypothetical protein
VTEWIEASDGRATGSLAVAGIREERDGPESVDITPVKEVGG